MVTKVCKCGATFEFEPMYLFGKEMFTRTTCDPCMERDYQERAAADERDRSERKARALAAKWDEICPALYQNTDPLRIPSKFNSAASGWMYGAKGMGFVGEAGKCKTRVAFQLLKRFHFGGKSCAAVSSTRLAMLASDQFSNDEDVKSYARSDMRDFRRADLLLIDDLGKGKMSDRAEMELFDILEVRTSNTLPTIWTANASAKELRAMMSGDRGAPILRRLAEFSEIVTA